MIGRPAGRRYVYGIGGIVPLVCLAAFPCAPPDSTPASASNPSFVVKLTITGGYSFSGTLLATSTQWEGYSCDAFAKVHQYTATYNLDAEVRAHNGDLSKDAFQFVVWNYTSSRLTYRKNISLFVLVRHHAY